MNWILVYSHLRRTIKERIVRSIRVNLLFPTISLEAATVATKPEMISKIRRIWYLYSIIYS